MCHRVQVSFRLSLLPSSDSCSDDELTHVATDVATAPRADDAALSPDQVDEADALREAVLAHLRVQGFVLTDKGLLMDVPRDKDAVRRLHDHAVQERREAARPALEKVEPLLMRRLVPSAELDVSQIRPTLRLVDTYRHPDAALWRWASLHWSIPVSAGYGRRLRYVVVDEGHDDALMGVIGLGDPVFAMKCRDQWVGWDHERRRTALSGVMDAFVLGAVPPYRDLLAGKLVALLAVSREVVAAFHDKFGDRTSLISERVSEGRLALVTTTSALGRSSVYNRLHRPDRTLAFEPIGVTSGSGDFHLSGSLYDRLVRFAKARTEEGQTHRHERWPGTTFRNRREVVLRALVELGLPDRALRTHGIQRQVFAAPTASNTREYLLGRHKRLRPWTLSVAQTNAHWLDRWALPRADRQELPPFDPEQWRLYRC